MTTRVNELKLGFVVAPLDDCIDSENPVMAKWQVREAMQQFMDDYIDKLMNDDDYATVYIAGRKRKVPKGD